MEAVAVEEKFFMVHAELVEDGGMPILNAHAIFYCSKAYIIGFAVHSTAFHAAASHPVGKAAWAVVATGLGIFTLSHWQSTEFSAPQNKHIIEQSTLPQITQQSGGGKIALFTGCR